MSKRSIKAAWKIAWKSPVKQRQLILIMVLIPVFSFSLPFFFHYIEQRKGVVLNDLLLALIPAYNVSILIFACIWSMIFLIIYRSVYSPSIFITYCFTLAFVTAARMLCIYLVPLSPPKGLIPLIDPLSGAFYGEASITKDLFFSGHTATLVTIYFCLERKTDKRICFFTIIVVPILLLIQHIHYTIDVLAAPIVVYVFYLFTCYLLKKNKRRQKKLPKEYSVAE